MLFFGCAKFGVQHAQGLRTITYTHEYTCTKQHNATVFPKPASGHLTGGRYPAPTRGFE